MQEVLSKQNQEIERLQNIIKEVREYIKSHREAVDERGEHIIYFLKDDFDEEDDYEDIVEDEDIKREFDEKEAVAEENKAVETAAEAEKTDKNEV